MMGKKGFLDSYIKSFLREFSFKQHYFYFNLLFLVVGFSFIPSTLFLHVL